MRRHHEVRRRRHALVDAARQIELRLVARAEEAAEPIRPEIAPADLGPDWLGGFFCPCHQSKFDLAGRVYKGVPAPTNLKVPPHKYLSDTKIVIGLGQDGKEA